LIVTITTFSYKQTEHWIKSRQKVNQHCNSKKNAREKQGARDYPRIQRGEGAEADGARVRRCIDEPLQLGALESDAEAAEEDGDVGAARTGPAKATRLQLTSSQQERE
jgi:hypothetical protein